MPIAALPQTTIRAIGSTSVISDPCSVVKELLDNALDASATSLSVEISQNTLDVIQLRDNGHGIPSDDHAFVCKHTFTSKIQTINDLKNVGGSSLGFRGEALASVAEMSGGVTITTRTTSDVTGSCLKYARDGELSHSQRTSHPEGTTIRITDFLKYVPVRKQAAFKSATRTLISIKKLLQSYAFAQPSKRFSLKVLKAKNENNNWVYAPAVNATISDAALKIVGRDVSSCCIIKQLSSEVPREGDDSGFDSYHLTAFLPKPDAEIHKANNTGQFVSIDGRPLSTCRGIGQSIVKLFKAHVWTTALREENPKATFDPFLCLHVKCPQGAYDVNIEPGKDDVLFEDRDLVLSLIGDLFRGHLGPLPDSPKKSPAKRIAGPLKSVLENDTFDLLMARRQPSAPVTQSNAAVVIDSTKPHSSSERPLQSPDQSPNEIRRVNNDLTDHSPRHSESQSRYINPWSISRINASFQTPRKERETGSFVTSKVIQNKFPTESRSHNHSPSHGNSLTPEAFELVSPPETRPMSSSPVSFRRRMRPTHGSPTGPKSTINETPNATTGIRTQSLEQGALDSWFQRKPQNLPGETRSGPSTGEADDIPTLSELASQRFGMVSDVSIPETPSATMTTEKRDDNLSTGLSLASRPQSQISGSSPGDHQLDAVDTVGSQTASLQMDLQPETRMQIEKALDFEKRKKEAIQQRHAALSVFEAQCSTRKSSAVSHGPHRKRYLAAKAALSAEADPFYEPTSSMALSSHDPRGYLIRVQNKHGMDATVPTGPNSWRTYSSGQPFENIPDGWDLHDTRLVLPANFSATSSKLDISLLDLSSKNPEDCSAFFSSDMESVIPFWNERLTALMNQQYKTQEKSVSPGLQIDLSPILTKHLTQSDEK
ncbi:hypothetical protein N7492_001422 [Penicillium capsulatum]|uniref:DNA mismatch repair protein S5 domain-containing protein n=1 Tax=Penicillium capsulatum TaxID=69766 RepID=A0A9W9LZE4_9EURO|nr:hypothetical protein N7492_001422 [Penicillium capsulatum]KAJ6129522.1 hypothetical protein N7512_002302 [Penicillium capsulatum]